MALRSLLLLLVTLVFVAGCDGAGSDEDLFQPDETAPRAAPEEPTAVSADAYTVMESGLKYHDLEVGDGEELTSGDIASVHYTGWLQAGGTRFDSSLPRGESFVFRVGAGRVIAGWDEGVVGMREGGTRQLVIPPELGYGAQGAGNVVPPNATLIFEVELLDVR